MGADGKNSATRSFYNDGSADGADKNILSKTTGGKVKAER